MLVRAAHSANIKERRDASTALFDGDGADGDAGRAHPGAPRRDARRGRGGARRGPPAGRRLDPERPLPRRHAPARHHRRVPPVPRRPARPASRPPARTTPTSAATSRAACRPTRRRLDQEGVVIPPTRVAQGWEMDDRLLGSARRRACAARASARPTCARSWRPTASPHGASTSSPSATDEALLADAMDGGARLRRAPHARARSRRSPTGPTAPPTCSRTTAADEPRDLLVRCSVTVAGDAIEVDFTGTAPQSRRQSQLPAVGDEVRRVLRRAGADRPGHPALAPARTAR